MDVKEYIENGVFDFISDNREQYAIDYQLFDFGFDESGRPSCSIKFSDDKHIYTVTDWDGSISIDY